MENVVKFNKKGYDPFIDFIKAYSILCVLMGHTFPFLDETGYSLWYGMQVPLFVLVQVFHSFKKDTISFNVQKITKRILIPYLSVQLGIFFVSVIFSDFNIRTILLKFTMGGVGPGAYYPWVYIQLALLLPIVKPWFSKGTRCQKAVIAIVVCEMFEIISSVICLPNEIHRLLAIRYVFLIYLGWIWVDDGIVLNKKTLIFSLFSMCAIIYFEYFYTDIEPWFYDTDWKTHRWPCYFYVSTLFCYILHAIYSHIKRIDIVDKGVKILARCSYEIFLLQMAVITVCPPMEFIQDKYLRFSIRFSFIWTVSILGGYYLNMLYGKIVKKD